MPYIPEERREDLLAQSPYHQESPRSSGELNYLITELIRAYFYDHKMGYAAINDVLGALEGAKLEFYRRLAVPYEQVKIEENGDVY